MNSFNKILKELDDKIVEIEAFLVDQKDTINKEALVESKFESNNTQALKNEVINELTGQFESTNTQVLNNKVISELTGQSIKNNQYGISNEDKMKHIDDHIEQISPELSLRQKSIPANQYSGFKPNTLTRSVNYSDEFNEKTKILSIDNKEALIIKDLANTKTAMNPIYPSIRMSEPGLSSRNRKGKYKDDHINKIARNNMLRHLKYKKDKGKLEITIGKRVNLDFKIVNDKVNMKIENNSGLNNETNTKDYKCEDREPPIKRNDTDIEQRNDNTFSDNYVEKNKKMIWTGNIDHSFGTEEDDKSNADISILGNLVDRKSRSDEIEGGFDKTNPIHNIQCSMSNKKEYLDSSNNDINAKNSMSLVDDIPKYQEQSKSGVNKAVDNQYDKGAYRDHSNLKTSQLKNQHNLNDEERESNKILNQEDNSTSQNSVKAIQAEPIEEKIKHPQILQYLFNNDAKKEKPNKDILLKYKQRLRRSRIKSKDSNKDCEDLFKIIQESGLLKVEEKLKIFELVMKIYHINLENLDIKGIETQMSTNKYTEDLITSKGIKSIENENQDLADEYINDFIRKFEKDLVKSIINISNNHIETFAKKSLANESKPILNEIIRILNDKYFRNYLGLLITKSISTTEILSEIKDQIKMCERYKNFMEEIVKILSIGELEMDERFNRMIEKSVEKLQSSEDPYTCKIVVQSKLCQRYVEDFIELKKILKTFSNLDL